MKWSSYVFQVFTLSCKLYKKKNGEPIDKATKSEKAKLECKLKIASNVIEELKSDIDSLSENNEKQKEEIRKLNSK